MTQHYADNLVKNPEQFKTGLGKNSKGKKKKNSKGKKRDTEKREKGRIEKPSKFVASVTQGPLECDTEFDHFTQGPVEWLLSKLAGARNSVEDTLRAPVEELVEFLREEQVGSSLRELATSVNKGSFKVLFGLDNESIIPVILFLFVLAIPHLTRVQVISTFAVISVCVGVFSPGGSLTFVLDKIKGFCGIGTTTTQFSFEYSTCYKFAITCFALWQMKARYGEESSSFEKVHAVVKSFKYQMSKTSDLFESLGSFQEFLKDAIETVNKLFGLDFDTSMFQGETWFEIEKLNQKYVELRDMYEKRVNLHSAASQMVSLEAYGMSLLNRFKAGGPAYIQYRDAMFRIVALREELGKMGVYGNSTRQEPLFVLVGGQAGVGKSSASKVIQGVMIKESCGVDAVKEFNRGNSGPYVYVPEQESKFLDGYHNQAICLLDDFGSSVDALQNWAGKLIPLVNSQAMMTPQASLERKGAVYFDSKFILGTTNVTAYAGVLQNMYSKEAVTRRMHVTVKCRVKPEFAKASLTGAEPTLDETLTEAYYLENPSAPPCFWLDWWWFNPLTGEETPLCRCGRICKQTEVCSRATTQDVLKIIVETYRYRAQYQLKSEQRMRDFLECLETEEDTLDVLEQAFTQSKCNNPICYACATTPERRSVILAVQQLTPHYQHTAGPNSESDMIPFEVSHEEDLERLKNLVTNRDVAKRVFGFAGAFTPVCVEHLYKQYNFVDQFSPKFFVIDYHQKVKAWTACQRSSRLVNLKEQLRYSWYESSEWSTVEKLKVVGTILGVCVLAFSTVFTLSKLSAKGKRKKKVKKASVFATVQSADAQHDQVVKSILSSNVLYLDDGGAFCGYAFGIGSELVVLNKHIFYTIRKNHENISFKKMTSKKNAFSYTVKVKELVPFENDRNDLVCLRVPGFHCQNVAHHIADDIHMTPSFNVRLSHWNDENGRVFVSMNSGMARLGRPVAAKNSDGDVFTSVDTLEYDIATENGQCGAVLTRVDATKRSKIVGIHAAGSPCGTRGIGIILRKDFIEGCFKHFDIAKIQYDATSDIRAHFSFVEAAVTDMKDVQIAGKATSVATTYKSEITKSPLYGKLSDPPMKRPALLNPFTKDNELFDPVAEALKAYSRGGVLCNLEVLRAAVDVYNHELARETSKPTSALLTFEESVCGSRTKAPWLKPINRGTASGSPSRFNPSVGTKKRMAFGYDEVYTFDTEGAIHVKQQVEQALEALRRGPIPMVFVAFPKDELRPSEKVKAGKTRVVFSCDVVNTILIRKYFGAFASWYQDPSNRFKNSSAVGVNVADQFEIKTYVEKLGSGALDVDVFAGDYSGFDKSLPSYVIESVWSVYESVFGHLLTIEDKKIARHIFLSFTKPYVQYKDCLIEWDNSNPSGNPITTILNTICNNVVLRYGVARCYGKTSYGEARKLLKSLYEERAVEYICYGDDNVWKVDTNKIKKYGPAVITYSSITSALSEMGLVYTDEEKSSEFDESHRSVFDISFLKRRVRIEDGCYFMTLSLDTITQNIQWSKKKDVDGELFRVKVEGFLDELSIHDATTWSFWQADFFEAARQVDPRFHLKVEWNKSREARKEEYLARGCEYW